MSHIQFNDAHLNGVLDRLADDLANMVVQYGFMANGYCSWIEADRREVSDLLRVEEKTTLTVPKDALKNLTATEIHGRLVNVAHLIDKAWEQLIAITPTDVIPQITVTREHVEHGAYHTIVTIYFQLGDDIVTEFGRRTLDTWNAKKKKSANP